MTWIVVFPSTLVMMGWIAVYSFFQTSDFIHEVIILFGGIPFWATVFLSAAVALGLYPLLSRGYLNNVGFSSTTIHRQVFPQCLRSSGQGHRPRDVGAR